MNITMLLTIASLLIGGVAPFDFTAATMADQYIDLNTREYMASVKLNSNDIYGWGPSTAVVKGGFVLVWISSYSDESGRHQLIAKFYTSRVLEVPNAVIVLCNVYPRLPPKIAASYSTGLVHVVYQVGTLMVTSQLIVENNGITLTSGECPVDTPDMTYLYQHAIAASYDESFFVTASVNTLPSQQTNGITLDFFVNGRTYQWHRVLPYKFSWQSRPDVAVLNNGNILVVWQQYAGLTISGHIFTRTGLSIGETFQVDAGNEMGGVGEPFIITKKMSSGFIILWKEDSEMATSQKDPTPGIWLREFTENGEYILEEPFTVRLVRSELSQGTGFIPTGLMGATDSNLVVVWLEGTTLNVDMFSLQHDGTYAMRLKGSTGQIHVTPGFGNIAKPALPLIGDEFGFSIIASFGPSDPLLLYTLYNY